jgi:RimJ/RimL family protein N-acetyltransferase
MFINPDSFAPLANALPTIEKAPAILPQYRVPCLFGPKLETARLRLRRWERHDLVPYIAMCRDPEVMKFFNGLMAPVACFEEVERQEICFDTHQYGMWAVELKETHEFIGTVGIEPTMMMTARMTWKLRREFWSQNYAYEAGLAVLDYAFRDLEIKEAFALVDPSNTRSLRLMERLGLKNRDHVLNCFFKAAA